MKKAELEEIFYINKEISLWENELKELRQKSLAYSPKITGMPKGTLKYSLDDYAADLLECEEKINTMLAKAQAQKKKVTEYIETISDSRMRQIVYLRAVKGLKWTSVARKLCGVTPDSVRMEYNRFLNSEPQKME